MSLGRSNIPMWFAYWLTDVKNSIKNPRNIISHCVVNRSVQRSVKWMKIESICERNFLKYAITCNIIYQRWKNRLIYYINDILLYQCVVSEIDFFIHVYNLYIGKSYWMSSSSTCCKKNCDFMNRLNIRV